MTPSCKTFGRTPLEVPLTGWPFVPLVSPAIVCVFRFEDKVLEDLYKSNMRVDCRSGPGEEAEAPGRGFDIGMPC